MYLFGAFGGLLFGYDLGVVSGALLYITPHFRLNSTHQGYVTSSLLLGAMIGALGCVALSDRFGRARSSWSPASCSCSGRSARLSPRASGCCWSPAW